MWNFFDCVKIVILAAFCYNIILFDIRSCDAEKVLYISTERPKVTYYNPRYIAFANLTSTRYGRRSPMHYVDFHFSTLLPFGKNVNVDFYFYEYLTNRYKPSFVEMHFNVCTMLHNDLFFGAALKQGLFKGSCPFPPGDYNFYNMSIDIRVIPHNFPFRKGRIYCNISSTSLKATLMSGHIDMEIKEMNVKKLNKV